MKRAIRVVALGMWLAALALPAAQPDRARTEANLRSLKERIERIQRQVQEDAAEKDRITRDLRAAEQSVARAQGELGKVRSQRSETSAERARLQQERSQRVAERDRTQDDLASQLRSAYMMGRSEPLKMLLNQRSPAQFQRNLTYYGYFGRDRASKINLITQNITEIDELASKIEEQDDQLEQLDRGVAQPGCPAEAPAAAAAAA
jgi:murein hydrolase activator